MIMERQSMSKPRGLAFRGISKRTGRNQPSSPHILWNVTGACFASQLVALMGLSGCGKTTLLHILSGRVSSREYCGDILLDGVPLVRRDRRRISLVLQEDVYFPVLTIREHLFFTAMLRLKTSGTSVDTIHSSVALLIDHLSLEKCADTRIQYLSGGEKRRCSTASELLSRPRVLLLDEALSGLDSAAASSLMSTLRKFASSGLSAVFQDSGVHQDMLPPAVVLSLHQPSTSILHSFDMVLILSEGCAVFYGSPSEVDHFAWMLGVQCLAAARRLAAATGQEYTIDSSANKCSKPTTSLDFVIDRLSSKNPWLYPAEESCEQIEAGDLSAVEMTVEFASQFLYWPRYAIISMYDETRALMDFTSLQRDEEMTSHEGEPLGSSAENETVLLQPYKEAFQILLKRAMVLTCRSAWAATSSLTETIIIAIIGGLCWWNTKISENSVTDVSGFLSFTTTYWFFATLYVGLMEFIPERLVVQKERDAGAYQVSAFFLSKNLANMPLRLALPVLFVVISYPMVFHQDISSEAHSFVVYLCIVILVALCGESLGQAIGAITSNLEIALTIATAVSLSMLMFGGFYTQNIPTFLSWLSYFSALKYSFDASVQTLIGSSEHIRCNGGQYIPACYGQNSVSSSFVLDWLNANSNSLEVNIICLALMAVVYRLIAYLLLRFLNQVGKKS